MSAHVPEEPLGQSTTSRLVRWWVESKSHLAGLLHRAGARRLRGSEVRLFAPDELRPSQVETVRGIAHLLAPKGVPVELYLLPQSHTPLFDLTCSMAAQSCETVSFHRALLTRADRKKELAQRIGELFHKCLVHPPA